MSENNNDLNEMFEEEMDDATVITVPIDDTLSNSGEAADAKAVGDALALKADKTELQTAITVNGQSADAQGAILVDGTDIPMSSTDPTTMKAAIEAVDGKTGADIPVDSTPGAQTIKQALNSGATRTADQIEMSASDDTTVKAAIEVVAGDVENAESAIAQLQNQTGADIPYQSGSQESIKQHVDALEAGKVKTVNEIGPDENGNIQVDRVPYADNLYTEDATEVDESFMIRTTGGSGSLSDGNAWAQKIEGNMSRSGYVAESITKTVIPQPRTAPAAITASIDNATFIAEAEEAGTYEFNYTTAWDVTPSDYGISVSNTPIDGDKITVVWDGENDPVMTVSAAERTAPPAITATVDRDTWVGYVANSGTYTFTYTTVWKLSGTEVDMTDYGITVVNDPIAGDEIVIVYVKEVRGTMTVANPTALVATGWNIYDHTNGYARCVVYSNLYGYAISGAYTSIAWAATPDGETTALTPDEDGLFDVPGTGYIIVTGGNGTDTAIWTTWSDWEEGYEGSWEAYSESTISLTAIMTANFPYGLCKIGSGASAVVDEIDLRHKQAISRISRVEYSDEARATAAASGRAYTFDENYVWQERQTPIVNSITVDEEYTVSEHGLEWFAGSAIELYAEILYGTNLKDKLKRDVLTISPQVLTSGQKATARSNIGAADAAATSEAIAKVQDEIGKVVNGNSCAGYALNKGDYVIVKNSTITGITDGLYTYSSSTSKSAGDAVSAGELTAVSGGIANELNSKLTSMFISKIYTASWTCSAGSSKELSAEDFNVSIPSGYTPIAIQHFDTDDPRVIPSRISTRIVNSTSTLMKIYNPSNASFSGNASIRILFGQISMYSEL